MSSMTPKLGPNAPKDDTLQVQAVFPAAPEVGGVVSRIRLLELQRLELTLVPSQTDAKPGWFMDARPAWLSCPKLPPGAFIDVGASQVVFQPDFTQGGVNYELHCRLRGTSRTLEGRWIVDVVDTVAPPEPRVMEVEQFADYRLLTVMQTTDDWLDSPGYAGREFRALVTIPSSSSGKVPVRLMLHGYGAGPSSSGSATEIRVAPHDPELTYWWGYAEDLPAKVSGVAQDYTQRRVMHLLAWVLRTVSSADAERVYVHGGSMGGAGALSIGLRYARHFAYVHSLIGQTIARNHRPRRVAQLSTHWGSPSVDLHDPSHRVSVWNAQDSVAVLRDRLEARQQFIYTYHGKDDPIIHFGAALDPSPVVGLSFLQAMQAFRIGHYSVWDEGGHGRPDPVLGAAWVDAGWDRIHDTVTFLRRDLAFPAFSQGSGDQDAGDGGNGRVPYSESSAYAGDARVIGDTGWNGDIAGAYNRFLRWDSRTIEDTPARFSVAVWIQTGVGAVAPAVGYPSTGDLNLGPNPLLVDITPRRTQQFRCAPNETVRWRYGDLESTAICGQDFVPTIPRLPVRPSPMTLYIERI